MRETSAFSIITASALLVVCTFIGCHSPFFNTNLPENPVPLEETAAVPLGLGDLRVISYGTGAQGPLVLYVENNELAGGVSVLSEIPGGNLACGAVVRVYNANNNSYVSVFYREDQKFPWKMAITLGEEEVTALFSGYDMARERFSVVFRQGDEVEHFENLVMNKNVFSLYGYKDGSYGTWHTRIRTLITTLCIWDSIALQIPGSDFTVGARALGGGGAVRTVSDVFTAIPVIALTASVVPVPPGSIAAGRDRSASSGPALVLSLSMMSAALTPGPLYISLDPDRKKPIPEGDVFQRGPHAADTVPPEKPDITVKQGGSEVTNNGTVYYLATIGDSITFDIQFFGEAGTMYPLRIYEPNEYKYIGPTEYNAVFFEAGAPKNDDNDTSICHITIKRIRSGTGVDDGKVQFIIEFGRNITINGSDAGVPFKIGINETEKIRKDIFILNFTSRLSP